MVYCNLKLQSTQEAEMLLTAFKYENSTSA